jgi:hypothetical protein
MVRSFKKFYMLKKISLIVIYSSYQENLPFCMMPGGTVACWLAFCGLGHKDIFPRLLAP